MTTIKTHVFVAVVVFFAALALMHAERAEAYDNYAAMAYSYSTGNYGYGYNYDTQWGAEDRALAECRAYDCEIVVWVMNGCLSMAANDYGGIGTGWAADYYGAENDALYDCGGGCWIVETVCTD